MIVGLTFSETEFILVNFTSELNKIVAYYAFLALYGVAWLQFDLIIICSFNILLFPKLCYILASPQVSSNCTASIAIAS